jgi:hypothetical protein
MCVLHPISELESVQGSFFNCNQTLIVNISIYENMLWTDEDLRYSMVMHMLDVVRKS